LQRAIGLDTMTAVIARMLCEENAMKAACWVVLGFGAMVFASATLSADDKKADAKGVVVEFGALKSNTPAEWKEEEIPDNARRLGRIYQFQLAKKGEDKDDAQVLVFYFMGGGGDAKANIDRWRGMFNPPEGKKIDDVAKTTEMKVGDVPVTYFEVEGTYKFKKAPFDPNAEVTLKPDYKMVGVIFDCPKGPYYVRLVGPAKTVGEYKKGFDEWLKAFK